MVAAPLGLTVHCLLFNSSRVLFLTPALYLIVIFAQTLIQHKSILRKLSIHLYFILFTDKTAKLSHVPYGCIMIIYIPVIKPGAR